jgi:sugar phosphate isomerase/epimerase
MRLGIFAKTFPRPTVEDVFDAVRAAGFQCVQFNFACAGLPTLPEEVGEDLAERIVAAAEARGIELVAVSGTFNTIDPDLRKRQDGLRLLRRLIEVAERMRVPLVTLCTGTRDPDNMWKRHPDNDTPAAWQDLVESIQWVLGETATSRVALGIEPEVANVIDSAVKCRRLLDEIGSPRLKVVMDGANLFHQGELSRMREVLDESFELLGPDIALTHAKDLARDGEAGDRAAGTGVLDYDRYLALLRTAGYNGPLVLHGLREDEVAGSVKFLNAKLVGAKT